MPINQKLRDDLSWIYSLGGGTRLSYHAGSVEVNGQVDSSHREQTLSIIREHMDRLCNDLMGTRDHDVLRSRRRMRFALDEQDLMERLSSVGHHALFTRVAVNRRAELESYLSVTREEIREIAQIVFNGPEKIAVVTNQ